MVTSPTGLSVNSTAAVVQVVVNARPINISARAAVGGGAKVVVAGFVVVGATSETVLIRGVGATLASFGLEGWLTSQTLKVRDANNKIVGPMPAGLTKPLWLPRPRAWGRFRCGPVRRTPRWC